MCPAINLVTLFPSLKPHVSHRRPVDDDEFDYVTFVNSMFVVLWLWSGWPFCYRHILIKKTADKTQREVAGNTQSKLNRVGIR